MTPFDWVFLVVISVIVLVLVVTLVGSAVATILESRARAGHDWEDSDCVFWTGDRAGYNLRAVCPLCKGS